MFSSEKSNNTKKHGTMKTTSTQRPMFTHINGVGFDWSDMAEEQSQTNMALMAFSDSELNQTKFTAATYKRGLATIEEQLVTYRKNEVLFSEEVAVLKREVAYKDYEITSKSLDKLLGSQITDRSKNGLGYNVVPPPHPLIYNGPTKIDLSYSGLDEFKEPKFKSYGSNDKYVNTAMRHYHTERPRAGNTDRSYTEPVNDVRAKRVMQLDLQHTWGLESHKHNGITSIKKDITNIDARVDPVMDAQDNMTGTRLIS
ncbi:hypothetical protein Tco_0586078 [Tanacetum coccineum]